MKPNERVLIEIKDYQVLFRFCRDGWRSQPSKQFLNKGTVVL